jgi:hypothetical protein
MKIQIGEWPPGQPGASSLQQDIHMLADVLRAIVHMGLGVTFVVPFSLDDASALWAENVPPGVRAGTRRVLVARDGDRIVGTLQIDLPTSGTAPRSSS